MQARRSLAGFGLALGSGHDLGKFGPQLLGGLARLDGQQAFPVGVGGGLLQAIAEVGVRRR